MLDVIGWVAVIVLSIVLAAVILVLGLILIGFMINGAMRGMVRKSASKGGYRKVEE